MTRQYEFTGDDAFLRARALPYLLEAALFLESRFEKGKDGFWHAREATAYEGWVTFRDVISELVYGRVLFAAVLSALERAGVKHPKAARWKEIGENLAPLPMVRADREIIDIEPAGPVLRQGWFAGETAASDELLAVGLQVDTNTTRISKAPRKKGPAAQNITGRIRRINDNFRIAYPLFYKEHKCYCY